MIFLVYSELLFRKIATPLLQKANASVLLEHDDVYEITIFFGEAGVGVFPIKNRQF